MSAGGGVIISPSHVLTAGHVMVDKYTGVRKPEETKVLVGAGNIFDLHSYDAKNIHVHPKFYRSKDQTVLRFDVAIIELEKPMYFSPKVKPICLPTFSENKWYEGQIGWVSGWGAIGFEQKTSKDLLKAKVVIAKDDDCKNKFTGTGIEISESMICTVSSDSDACSGDSGGPLVLKDHDSKKYFLVSFHMLLSMGSRQS